MRRQILFALERALQRQVQFHCLEAIIEYHGESKQILSEYERAALSWRLGVPTLLSL